MPLYTTVRCPELLLKVKGSDHRETAFQALEQIVNLIDGGHLDADLFRGLSSNQLIEIKKEDLMPHNTYSAPITDAVKTLSRLAYSKQKMQELQTKAVKAYKNIDTLFEDDYLSEESYQSIRENLKLIEKYALYNLCHKKTLLEAQEAKEVLRKVLGNPGFTDEDI